MTFVRPLRELVELHVTGGIDDREFARAKALLLGSGPPMPSSAKAPAPAGLSRVVRLGRLTMTRAAGRLELRWHRRDAERACWSLPVLGRLTSRSSMVRTAPS